MSLRSIKPSVKSLRITPEPQEMHFECQVEAADALSRFAQGVGVLVQWQQELRCEQLPWESWLKRG